MPWPQLNLNGSPGSSFKVERGVRQGCPLASYLFLIIGEVLVHIIKKMVAEGRLRGISLLGVNKQQSISQYADDFFFMVRGEKRCIDELTRFSRYLAWPLVWKLIGRSHVHIGSINTRISRNDLTGTIDNG